MIKVCNVKLEQYVMKVCNEKLYGTVCDASFK